MGLLEEAFEELEKVGKVEEEEEEEKVAKGMSDAGGAVKREE